MWLFFFQAEDGIRDLTVTGVQTCALPIYFHGAGREGDVGGRARQIAAVSGYGNFGAAARPAERIGNGVLVQRTSREGGKFEIGRASCREECRSRWSPYH